MQRLEVFQSLWAMERRSERVPELSLVESISRIADAGFQGISTHWTDRARVAEVSGLLAARGLAAEGQCFPQTIDDLKPVLDNATRYPVRHLCLQPDIRPRRIDDCLPLLEGWQALGREAGIRVYIETHRDRMTTDLYFTLDLLERLPDLPLLGDLSHFLVGREFAWPISDENDAYMHRIIDNCWAFHGRVASREQVQVELSFAQHRPWLDLFMSWWRYGFASWRGRAAPDAALVFVCELGPKPYAITGRDGEDTTDRWQEALLLQNLVRAAWTETSAYSLIKP